MRSVSAAARARFSSSLARSSSLFSLSSFTAASQICSLSWFALNASMRIARAPSTSPCIRERNSRWSEMHNKQTCGPAPPRLHEWQATYREPLLLGAHEPEHLGLRAVSDSPLQQLLQTLPAWRIMCVSIQRPDPPDQHQHQHQHQLCNKYTTHFVPWSFSWLAARSQIDFLPGMTVSACA
jgi:hypothetical protein